MPELALAVAALPRLQLRGLMAIPAATEDQQLQRSSFARLHTAQLEIRELLAAADLPPTAAAHFDTLSMGMSGDLEAAIAEGSTLVRVGTDIFGPRG